MASSPAPLIYSVEGPIFLRWACRRFASRDLVSDQSLRQQRDCNQVVIKIEVCQTQERPAHGVSDDTHLNHGGQVPRPRHLRTLFGMTDNPGSGSERQPTEQHKQDDSDKAVLAQNLEINTVSVMKIVRFWR